MKKSDKFDLEKLYQRRLLDVLQHNPDWNNLSLFPISLSDDDDDEMDDDDDDEMDDDDDDEMDDDDDDEMDDDDDDEMAYFDYYKLFDDLYDELERAYKNKEDKIYLDVIRAALRECADLVYNMMLEMIE